MAFLQTAYDYAMFNIMQDCLDNTHTKQIGFEASLSNIRSRISEVEDLALNIEISGFS